MAPPRLNLDNITICAADCLNPGLAAHALARSQRYCHFADAILFTDAATTGDFRTMPIPPLVSRGDYSAFILRRLGDFITTDFVLIVQWDGHVIEPAAWCGEFLDHDYLGAPWPFHDHHRVGNGGFSLRSRRLLRALADMPDDSDLAEDEAICRLWRPALERAGISFAPEHLAARFSYERGRPEVPSFGFHGMFNMWRHLNDQEMVELVRALDARSTLGQDYVECFIEFYLQRRFAPLVALYQRWTARMSGDQIEQFLSGFIDDRTLVRDSLALAHRAAYALKSAEYSL
jgi:hypothetical protein